jgi:hypothetical protein
MSEGLEQLKALGAQKVHEDTHISRKNVEGIFNKSFEGMNQVQFAGFISILEREYGFDLSELKRDFQTCWEAQHGAVEEETLEYVNDSDEVKSSGKGLWIAVAVILGIMVFMWQQDSVTQKAEQLDTEVAVVTAEPAPVADVAPAEPVVEPEPAPEPVVIPTLSIVPKAKLWMGFIDIETNLREQKLTTKTVSLDTNRSWLMIFGHGHFKIEQNDEVIDFNSDNRLRFIYEDGILREISRVEFKERNRGENW